MNLRPIIDPFQIWIGAVEAAIIAAFERFQRPRQVRLIEAENNVFRLEASPPAEQLKPDEAHITIVDGVIGHIPPATAAVLKGSRTELILRSSRFLFRPLDVPQRAAEFLDGIVRAQIDRLTPWSASEAVFGWTTAAASAPERISLMICTTARSVVRPYMNALGGLGIESVIVSTFPEGEAAQPVPVRVLEDRRESRLGQGRIRRGLAGLLLLAALIAVLTGIANEILGGGLDEQKAELAHAISALRMSLHRAGASSPAQQLLEQHKRETPSAVIVLDALSRILPNHTYVTELRIEGDKLQIIGVTHDAPELIRLIEQSPNFTRATFFAPTTSTAGEPGEHFHIEARIKPVFAVGS
jgi:general secretion pathway protein L